MNSSKLQGAVTPGAMLNVPVEQLRTEALSSGFPCSRYFSFRKACQGGEGPQTRTRAQRQACMWDRAAGIQHDMLEIPRS